MKRRFMSILTILLVLVSFTACNPDTNTPGTSTGAGAGANDEEVIGAIKEALSVMQASMMQGASTSPSIAVMQTESGSRAIPDDMNFSEIFYELVSSTEADENGKTFSDRYSMMFFPIEEYRTKEIMEETEYGKFAASLPMFSQPETDGTKDITQHGENMTLRLDDILEFRISEYTIFMNAGVHDEPGGTTITCPLMEYTDKRQYTDGPLVSFSFEGKSTGEVIETQTGKQITMDVTISNLVYKGTPRTVTPAINEAANEFMNYPGSVN